MDVTWLWNSLTRKQEASTFMKLRSYHKQSIHIAILFHVQNAKR